MRPSGQLTTSVRTPELALQTSPPRSPHKTLLQGGGRRRLGDSSELSSRTPRSPGPRGIHGSGGRPQRPSLEPAGGLACAALGPCRTQQESGDSPRWPSTHMQQCMQEAAAESVRRLWDRAGKEANERTRARREDAHEPRGKTA